LRIVTYRCRIRTACQCGLAAIHVAVAIRIVPSAYGETVETAGYDVRTQGRAAGAARGRIFAERAAARSRSGTVPAYRNRFIARGTGLFSNRGVFAGRTGMEADGRTPRKSTCRETGCRRISAGIGSRAQRGALRGVRIRVGTECDRVGAAGIRVSPDRRTRVARCVAESAHGNAGVTISICESPAAHRVEAAGALICASTVRVIEHDA